MTKVFIARPPPKPPVPQPRSYKLDPKARALMIKGSDIKEPLKYPIPSKGPYLTDGGSSFDFELNVLDTASQRPIRAVEVESGLVKGFTDRVGRIVLHLPRGPNKVVVSGNGYVESGSFTPEAVKFEPVYLEVDLDSNAVYTVYSTGEVVPGERKVLDNPGHGSNSSEFEAFLRDNWITIGLAGLTGVGMYYLGKSKTQKT